MTPVLPFRWMLVVAAAMCLARPAAGLAASGGDLKFVVIDHKSRQPLAARIHLKNARGRPAARRGREILVHGDHFVIDGEAMLELPRGHYTFTLDAGPEFKPYTGNFEIQDDANDEKIIEMHRFVDLAADLWWAGDLLAVRLARHAEPLMRAEDLRILPLAIPAAARRSSEASRQSLAGPRVLATQRIAALQSIYVEDAGGAVVLHNVPPADVQQALARLSSTSAALDYADQSGGHVDVAFAASWDLPLWLAAGQVDSIQLIDSTAMMGEVRPLPPGCRRPDPSFFPGESGQGRWAERIYYHVLNCGFSIPPTAGSGSGLTPNPPGINRVYVHVDAPLEYDTWWTNLRAGRVFVTNGPLLRASVLGHPPGLVQHLVKGETLALQVGADLATRDRIEYLELVKNGDVEAQVRLEEWAESGGRLPPMTFDESGWLVVRAATNNPHVYQHATTGPFYVETEMGPRISRASVEFFLDWLDTLEERDSRQGPLDARRTAGLSHARAFFQDLASRSTAP